MREGGLTHFRRGLPTYFFRVATVAARLAWA